MRSAAVSIDREIGSVISHHQNPAAAHGADKFPGDRASDPDTTIGTPACRERSLISKPTRDPQQEILPVVELSRKSRAGGACAESRRTTRHESASMASNRAGRARSGVGSRVQVPSAVRCCAAHNSDRSQVVSLAEQEPARPPAFHQRAACGRQLDQPAARRSERADPGGGVAMAIGSCCHEVRGRGGTMSQADRASSVKLLTRQRAGRAAMIEVGTSTRPRPRDARLAPERVGRQNAASRKVRVSNKRCGRAARESSATRRRWRRPITPKRRGRAHSSARQVETTVEASRASSASRNCGN